MRYQPLSLFFAFFIAILAKLIGGRYAKQSENAITTHPVQHIPCAFNIGQDDVSGLVIVEVQHGGAVDNVATGHYAVE